MRPTKSFSRRMAMAGLRRFWKFGRFFLPEPKKIFIISHMRSGSTLLTHLLSSNPAILGYGETWTQYQSSEDLRELCFDLSITRRKLFFLYPYVLDKVLHNSLLSNRAVFGEADCRKIVLLREPAETLRSLLELFPDGSRREFIRYYVERIKEIDRIIEGQSGKDFLFLTYDDLTQHRSFTLGRLTRFLELRTPLTEEYSIFETTGKIGIGDPGKKILLGKIDSVQSRHQTPATQQPDLEEAQNLFTVLSRRFAKDSESLHEES